MDEWIEHMNSSQYTLDNKHFCMKQRSDYTEPIFKAERGESNNFDFNSFSLIYLFL